MQFALNYTNTLDTLVKQSKKYRHNKAQNRQIKHKNDDTANIRGRERHQLLIQQMREESSFKKHLIKLKDELIEQEDRWDHREELKEEIERKKAEIQRYEEKVERERSQERRKNIKILREDLQIKAKLAEREQ